MNEERIILEHNKMVNRILEECDYMLRHRYCMNGNAIKTHVENIKYIINYYAIEPKYQEGE